MKKIIKVIFCCFLLFVLFIYIDKSFKNDTNKENIFSFIINNSNYSSSKKNNKILENIFEILSKKNLLDPNNILKTNKNSSTTLQNNKNRVLSINNKTNNKPIIYLYSTHQTEEYRSLKNEFYNFKPTVMTASYILQDLLKEKDIEAVVEEKSIKKVLNKRNWDYSYSYRISREYMEQAKKTNPSLKYFIDIHRDSVPNKDIVTASINGKNYAKIMFLVGKNRDNYDNNMKIIKQLEKDLENNYKGITRNTYFQKLYDYNQDFSDDTYLLEIGASQNTIDEVYNSMVALSNTLEKYIKGEL